MLQPFRPLRTTPEKTIMKVHSLYSDAHERDPSRVLPYPDALRELIRNGEGAEYYVARSIDVDIAVLALYSRYERAASVEVLAVDRELRNRHLGSRALHELEVFARQDGLSRVTLTTVPKTVGFYEKNGYHIVRTSRFHVDMAKHIE